MRSELGKDPYDTEELDGEGGGSTAWLSEPSSEQRSEQPYLILVRGDSPTRIFKLVNVDTIIGRSGNADIVLQDSAISREHCLVTCLPNGTVRLKDLGSTNGMFVRGERISEVVLREGDRFQLGLNTVLKFSYEEVLIEQFQGALYEAAIRDTLTQIYNKRVLLEQLRLEFVYYQRHKRPLSLCLLNLDHFKHVNETWGYQAGDRLLVTIAKFVAGTIRAVDVFARYGGEQFAIVLRETSPEQAEVFGERLRSAMEAKQFTVLDRNGDPQTTHLTVSLGIATVQNDNYSTPEELIDSATAALAQAKSWGRNRVVLKTDRLSTPAASDGESG
jgi:diguanylate cyclase (GGDEF)-like protein